MLRFVTSENGPPDAKRRCLHCTGASTSSPTSTHGPLTTSSPVPQPSPLPTPTSGSIQMGHASPQRSFDNLEMQGNNVTLSPQPSLEPPSQRQVGNDNQEKVPNTTSREVVTNHIQNEQSPQSLDVRFIGDLSPESIFLTATSPDATRGISMNDSIGIWFTSTLARRASQPTLPVQSPSNLFNGSASLIQKVLEPLLKDECLSTLPSLARVEALSKIYFEKIHPIFPVIDEVTFRGLHSKDPSRVLLQQGICLAASKNFVAQQHLVLAESGPPLSCREFGDLLTGAMRLSIEMGLVSNKVVLIQALALMSQFIDCPESGDISSQLCGRAVHYVQSIGLHVKGRQEEYQDQYRTTLLSCVWAIDRLNAAFNGRPVLMHERDLRRGLDQCFEQQKPCFRLFLRIVMLLDKVIGLYRPSDQSENSHLIEDFPSFEDVATKCGIPQIGTSQLATIETLYHAVAILSCRSKSWADPGRSSSSYLRQSLSAASLSSTVSRELVIYREMRHSKLPLHRARARAQFQEICDLLSKLEDVFRSAASVAEMGKKLLKEMDRVLSTVTAAENRKPQHDSAHGLVNNGEAEQPTSIVLPENGKL